MDSLILRTATQFLLPLLLLFSVYLLLGGHNEPGGGFVGGLMAAGAVALYAIAYDVAAARRVLRVRPQTLIGSGLLLALGSALWPVAVNEPFFTGKWITFTSAEMGPIHLGTPLLFDLGVYVVVVGVTLLVVLSLLEE
ncbi:MAG: Na+/H+ antiporter subunit B [Pirellulaceae bacterium]